MSKSYIDFVEIEKKPKTSVYAVNSKSSGERLGVVKWHSTWRQYCFFPEHSTLWSHSCLAEIMGFLLGLMAARRAELDELYWNAKGDPLDWSSVTFPEESKKEG